MAGVRYAITTVVTPPTSSDLTTLENVKAELSISGNSDDAWLGMAISQVSQAISNYCNRVFGLATYKDVFRLRRDGRGLDPLVLNRFPLVAIASIVETIDGVDQTPLVEGTDYEVNASTSEIYRLDENGNPRNWFASLITIQYQAGWALPNDDDPTMPADIEQAALKLLTARYRSKGRDPMLKAEGDPGVGQQQYWVGTASGQTGLFPDDVCGILDNYRVPTT